MRQRFKGQTCAYCATVASSEAPDHIFARGFFPVKERDNLPRVPACRACNQAKAVLESYLLTVLPFGGECASSTQMLTEVVPRRLQNNLKLHTELSEGRTKVWVDRQGVKLPSFAVPIDGDRLISLFKLITRGLVAYHWKSVMPTSHVSRAGMFTPLAEGVMKDLFRMRAAAMVQGRLGSDTILYEGVRAIEDPYLTIWRYRIYGGMMLTGNPDKSSHTVSDIWATTTKPSTVNLFDFSQDPAT